MLIDVQLGVPICGIFILSVLAHLHQHWILLHYIIFLMQLMNNGFSLCRTAVQWTYFIAMLSFCQPDQKPYIGPKGLKFKKLKQKASLSDHLIIAVGLTAPVLCSWIKCLINLSGSVS
jgi:hypothetical protein